MTSKNPKASSNNADIRSFFQVKSTPPIDKAHSHQKHTEISDGEEEKDVKKPKVLKNENEKKRQEQPVKEKSPKVLGQKKVKKFDLDDSSSDDLSDLIDSSEDENTSGNIKKRSINTTTKSPQNVHSGNSSSNKKSNSSKATTNKNNDREKENLKRKVLSPIKDIDIENDSNDEKENKNSDQPYHHVKKAKTVTPKSPSSQKSPKKIPQLQFAPSTPTTSPVKKEVLEKAGIKPLRINIEEFDPNTISSSPIKSNKEKEPGNENLIGKSSKVEDSSSQSPKREIKIEDECNSDDMKIDNLPVVPIVESKKSTPTKVKEDKSGRKDDSKMKIDENSFCIFDNKNKTTSTRKIKEEERNEEEKIVLKTNQEKDDSKMKIDSNSSNQNNNNNTNNSTLLSTTTTYNQKPVETLPYYGTVRNLSHELFDDSDIFGDEETEDELSESDISHGKKTDSESDCKNSSTRNNSKILKPERFENIDIFDEDSTDDDDIQEKKSKQPTKKVTKKPATKKTTSTTTSPGKNIPRVTKSGSLIGKIIVELTEEEMAINHERQKASIRGAQPLAPPNLGSKALPKGKPKCLENKRFMITGVLDSIEREVAEDLIKKYGGKIVHTVTWSLNYFIKGLDYGIKKFKMAQIVEAHPKANCKIIDEDGLFDLISSSLSEKTAEKLPSPKKKPLKSENEEKKDQIMKTTTINNDSRELDEIEDSDQEKESKKPTMKTTTSTTPAVMSIVKNEISDSEPEKDIITPTSSQNSSQSSQTSQKPTSQKLALRLLPKQTSNLTNTQAQLPLKPTLKLNNIQRQTTPTSLSDYNSSNNNLNNNNICPSFSDDTQTVKVPISFKTIKKGHDQQWVDKYKPITPEDVVGNPGSVKTLTDWLNSWNDPKSNHSNKNASLLSGPPGIGKTTTAVMISKKLGFDVIELNASDTRSKKQMDQLLTPATSNNSITSFFASGKSTTAAEKKICIILDEIDGSSGNTDRGGIAEIIQSIKNSKVPFICICNDYYSPKLKTLKTHCLDIKFKRPAITSIQTRILQIAKHEGLALSQYMAAKIYESTNADIRQTIHLLQMMTRGQSENTLNDDNIQKKLDLTKKDFDVSPFTGAEKLLRFTRTSQSISDKLEAFFTDYSLVPLLIQDNYLKITLSNNFTGRVDNMDLYSKASDSMSSGDLMDRAIHKGMNFELLPSYGIVSSLIPSQYVSGNFYMPFNFPAYLGKYSNASKQSRLVRDLQIHTRASKVQSTATKNEMRLYMTPLFLSHLTKPLKGEIKNTGKAIESVLDFMEDYGLNHEDRDSIIELSTWKYLPDPLDGISTAVKSAFTKKINSVKYDLDVYDHDDLIISKKVSKGKSSSKEAAGKKKSSKKITLVKDDEIEEEQEIVKDEEVDENLPLDY